MQVIKTIVRLAVFFLPVFGYGQSTLLPRGSKFQQLLERMEIKEQSNLFFNVSSVAKPYVRSGITRETEILDSLHDSSRYSDVDFYNMDRLMMNNIEWFSGDKKRFASKHPFLKTFYKIPSDLFQVNEKDFFLSLNTVNQFHLSKETNNSQNLFVNTKGVIARGLIANKIGFDFYLTDNQERAPLFVQSRVTEHQAVPGAGFYKPFKTTGYDYFDARGSIYFTAAKYIHFQFGYDKNFIGSGYRSLFLSDMGTNNLFLKINTRIWKLDYQNLFMELTPSFIKGGGDNLLPRKYAAMHHLSLQATKWLNVGLFESIIFSRTNHFDLTYLNPVIFLRSIEQQNGSSDNALLGFDVKANIAKKFQLYTQVLMDEFKLSEVKAGNGWWANKFGIQAGAKYIDAFKIKNLDLQGEMNVVRPFTYSHSDSVANYTHYNQPLAHPLGANFLEMIAIIKYQPFPKWYAEVKLIAFKQGLDTASKNFGGNIFLPYTTRAMDYGNTIGSGLKANGINTSAWVGYEFRENLFIEASFQLRKLKAENRPDLSPKTTLFTIGIRRVIGLREYDY